MYFFVLEKVVYTQWFINSLVLFFFILIYFVIYIMHIEFSLDQTFLLSFLQ